MEKHLSKEFIVELSKSKNEPDWMLAFRLQSYEKFLELENPKFGPLIDFSFDEILYYKNEHEKFKDDWDKVDKNVKNT